MEKSQFKGIITFLFLAIMMAFSLGSNAQQKQLKGKVVDPDGAAVPGVTVVVKGTSIGTVTDLDGNFVLPVPADAGNLVFSYVGMTSHEVQIGNQTVFNITMQPDIIGVDEVVVVGYGTRMKEEVTGAVSTVSSQKLQISTAPSLVSRLQGQVSGVTVTSADRPGGEATIRIRGLGTINDNNPLYVIDGVPVGPGNNLNPGDIESISILKDASSAAIYGSRGANGVVIITTKRGREGQKPAINFSMRTGVGQASNQYDMLNTQEYAEAVWLQLKNQGAALSHAQYGAGATPTIPEYILPAGASTADHSLYNFPDVVIFKANKEGTNWYDEIERNAIIQEYELSVTGGGKGSTYSFSTNYLDEDGILEYTNFKRYTFRLNAESKFNSWFKAGESLQVSYVNEFGNLGDNGEGTVISQAYRMQPIIPVYDIMGNFAGTKAPEMGNASNPVAMLYRARNNEGKYVRILGSVFGEATLMKGLTAKTLLGYNWGQWNYKGYTIPTYEQSEPNKVNGMNADSNYSLQWNWTNTLNYNATFADIHKVNVVVGTEAIEYQYQELNASRSAYFSEDPLYMQLNSGTINKDNSGYGSEWSSFSVFGRVNYDLMGKYNLEATVRRDGSSRFGINNRYGTFPAASLGWAISQENFMAGTKGWLDLLRIKLGWGLSGNDRIGDYNSYSTFASSTYTGAYALDGSNTAAIAGFEPSLKGNPNVTWESTETINVGLDATMLNKSLTFSLDVWRRYTSDMLYQLAIPNVMGLATPPYVNIGEMKNVGFDFEAGYNNTALDGKLKYNIAATISRYKNELMKISDKDTETIDGATERQVLYTRSEVGTSFPEFYGYEVVGIFQTAAEAAAWPQYQTTDYNAPGHYKYKDQLTVDTNDDGVPDAADGVITPEDRTYIGSPHPDFTGGLNIDLAYGNFDLNLFFYGSYGNEMVNYVNRWISYGQFNGGLHKDVLYKSWGSPYLANNEDAVLPMYDLDPNSQEQSSAFVEDASFLRLKTLRLGYTLPKNLLDKAQIQSVRLYVQASNLFTLTKYSGLDPEVNQSGNYMGMDTGAWPTVRQFMFGLTIGL